jgi:hypothetical protein
VKIKDALDKLSCLDGQLEIIPVKNLLYLTSDKAKSIHAILDLDTGDMQIVKSQDSGASPERVRFGVIDGNF